MEATTEINNIIGNLGAVPVFENLAHEELEILATFMAVIELKPDDYFFEEGQPGDFIGFIAEGEIEVIKTENGQERVISRLRTGRALGETALVDQGPRTASMRAKTEVKIVLLRQAGFEMLGRKYPKLAIHILKWIARCICQYLRKHSSDTAEEVK